MLAIAKYPTNGHLIAEVARLGLLRSEDTTLDPTYGLGTFWNVWRPDNLINFDLSGRKGRDGVADFTALPFADESVDAVVFDPPYKLNGTPTEEVDERYGVAQPSRWQDRMALIRAGARECARVCRRTLAVKVQDQVVCSKIRWQTRAVADAVEPLGFALQARFDFLQRREQPAGRNQINPASCSSQLLVFRRGWKWSDQSDAEGGR